MVYYISCHITLLLLSTIVFADYHIDNANGSVIYSMPPSQSGKSWRTFAAGNQSLGVGVSNSTGNHSILFNASKCFNKNYAQGVCGTSANCFIQIPFTGSGITIYVFNAGTSGMNASFSANGGAAVFATIAAPTAAENYQASNVSLYDVQGLPSGSHTIKMTLMDWEGAATDMKFDYAYVSEALVMEAVPAAMSTAQTSSQMPTQTLVRTASTPNRIGVGGIVGITLGVAAVLGGIVIGILCYRKCRPSHQGCSSSASQSTFQIEPFTLQYSSSSTSSSWPHTQHSGSSLSLQSGDNTGVPPLMRSAILRDAHGVFSSAPIQRQSIRPGEITSVSQPVCHQPSDSAESLSVYSSMSHVVDEEPLAFWDPAIASRYNLTPAQVEIVRGLLADRVPDDAIARVIEAFGSSRFSTNEANTGQVTRVSEYAWSLESPPSYQTQDRC